MTQKDYSADAFFAFMDYCADKGLLKPNTAQSRKAAGKKMLEILESDDKNDLRTIDVEDLHQRFANKAGTGYTPDSLQVYKSRFKTAREDFLRWVENPTTFKPSTAQRENGARQPTEPRRRQSAPSAGNVGTMQLSQGVVFPVPLRPDLIIQIHNVPSDLTEAEAERIAAIVKALAKR